MNENTQMQDCTRKCWMLSAIAGVVIAILMIAFTGWTFFSSILAGIVIFVVGGFLLKSMLCGALADQAQDTAAPAPAPAPAQAAATPKPAADTAPVADAAAPEAESAEPAAVSAATAPADKVLVKPSARLAGQEELAARKGDWKYEKLAEAAPAKAAPAKKAPAKKAPAAKAPAAKAAANKDADAAATTKRAPVAADGKPEMLDAPREGGADDLKQIKGVGPKLEALLNEMGIYHFSQVAGWRKKEVEWADQNLVGFKGRVSRDEWVKQAKVLAKGGSTEFSNKVKKGGVY
ncbi:endonuclease [Pseudosulfitobacter pseudonitzschiae]|uniref:endonuclease n=1 Tax=Pseudosulfitobacter pseudonitzschiae TaxID=1402135 RepID=UPI001AFB29C7|nr:endonuclease [Pseudosulfitobacter pseudonitzschiae]MBM1814338.1 endonuclease [Pseudosulfitobacter pseudonitzschiae]MBM1831331.1 endonuclease [Pseudosulfitobacter pseudonitzschiae]MBM1836198.1 endonuclease [Pseudosulfitobacter pseudonitzschiae]MBM1841044.1 endonuclease [Pseudosulfitobacter pseudonitzschiae]MBM1845912.1 endonuclease [Pseudosulfitobacter pseudonitzschiae]